MNVRSLLLEPLKILAAIIRFAILNWPNTPLGFAMRRWYMKLRGASLGSSFMLMRGCDISGELMEIGDGACIAEDVVVALGPGSNKLILGDQSFIGPGTYIRNMNHRFDDPDVPHSLQGHEGTDIVIGKDVWIGGRCILLAGTKIGDHSVIAAGSVVSHEIPPYSIAVGNPARVVRKRRLPA